MRWLPAVWTLFKIQNINQTNSKAPALDICILFQTETLDSYTMHEVEIVGFAILLLEQMSSPPKQGANSADTGTIAVNRALSILCDACQRQKSRCVFVEGQVACVLCQSHSRICSFVSNTQPQLENLNEEAEGRLETVEKISNKSIRNNIFHHLSESLETFLASAFSGNCCRRKCLTSQDWLLMFADLCSCSILKSLLIDTQAIMNVSRHRAPADFATRIDSAYKVLVSIFAWAAKSDLLVDWYRPADMEDSLSEVTDQEAESFRKLCRLVQRGEWEKRGIKSSKDFLMGLGSGFYNDGTYNGFYIQRYGLQEPRKPKVTSSSRRNVDMTRQSEANLHDSSSVWLISTI